MRKKIIALFILGTIGTCGLLYFLYTYAVIGGEIIKVPANPQNGFNYGYFLYIPRGTQESQIKNMLVEPNNTGKISDDDHLHEQSADNLIKHGAPNKIARKLKTPLLVPLFGRPSSNPNMYTHALDRDTLMNNDGKLARIDLQLINMIQDARKKLGDKGIALEDKIFMHGFSASGSFTSRFTAIHPDMVKAMAAGGLNAMPILPAANLEGENLIYPIGISDLDQIAGAQFKMDEYKKVPQFVYMGYMDDNDSLPYSDAFGAEEKDIIKRFLGTHMKDRWKKAASIYTEMNIPAQLVMYNGVGHEITSEMINDIAAFFKSNTTDQIVPIEPHQYAFKDFKELESVHIREAYWNGDGKIKKPASPDKNQFIILTEEWIKGRSYKQLDEFLTNLPNESKEFVLQAEGKKDVICSINGNFSKDDGSYQGYMVELTDEELEKMEIGMPYAIHVNNKSDTYFWIVNQGVTITRTK